MQLKHLFLSVKCLFGYVSQSEGLQVMFYFEIWPDSPLFLGLTSLFVKLDAASVRIDFLYITDQRDASEMRHGATNGITSNV